MGKSARWILGFFGVKRSPKFPRDDCSLDGSSKEPHLKRGTKEKRRWSLGGRKPSSRTLDQTLVQNGHPGKQTFGSMDIMEQEQKSKHAMAVAVAAAAEAALAADVDRLTGNDLPRNEASNRDRDHLAAIKVQTAFRGHLARRALRALKAVVRLQALFRGQQVRKQAAMTLQCMQALVKVQARARARARHVEMSEEGHTVRGQLSQRRRSQQAYPRTSVEEWNASSGRKEKLQAKVEKKQQAATNCERLLAYETTQYSSTPPRAGWSWIDRWMVGRSPVLGNPKGGNGGGIGMEISSEESSSIFGPASAKRSNFRISKKRMGCTADSFSLDHISSAAIHTWPSPPVDSFRSTDRSPSTRMALKQRANSTTHQAQQLVCFASTPNSLSCRSRSSSVGGLPVPGLDHMSTGCQLALKENHILEQEEYYDITSNSADSSLAFSSTGPHSARHTGFFGFPGMDQKENMLHFPKYMTATKSTEAKVRSQSAPKQRPAASEKQYVPAASGKIRNSPSWADKPSYSTTRGSEGKSQFQRSVSQVRTRSKVSAAAGF